MFRIPLCKAMWLVFAASVVPLAGVLGQDCSQDQPLISATELEAVLDSAFVGTYGAVGVAAKVSVKGVGTWTRAHGYSDRERQTELLPDDRFRIASITKTFVAVLVLRLDQDGILDVDDPLDRWVPSFPRAERITLRHLLSHTSGIGNYTEAGGTNRTRIWTLTELAAVASGQSALFEPGERYSYSNSNYILLAMVVEAATGQTWYSELRRRILEPLGLGNTFVDGSEPIPGGFVEGYSGSGVQNVTRDTHGTFLASAGGMVSNARDLVRWFEALFGAEILDEEHLALLQAPFPASDPYGTGSGYGLGLLIYSSDVLGTVYFHDGGWPGYRSMVFHIPSRGITGAWLMNSDTLSPDEIILHLVRESVTDMSRRDCNGNGSRDTCDLLAGESFDCNQNGVPDECDLVPQDLDFALAPAEPEATSPVQLEAGDFDGDGKLDLASANASTSRSVSVFFGRSDGSFDRTADIALGKSTRGLAAADLDGDRDLDLAVLEVRLDAVAVLLNQGDGSFGEARNTELTVSPRSIAVADLDLDGDVDLVVSHSGRSILVLPNRGDGSFLLPREFPLERNGIHILTADLNVDGYPDLAVTQARLSLLLNRGDGTFGEPVDVETGAASLITTEVAADLDGDGDSDLGVGFSGIASPTLLPGNGDGTFGEPVVIFPSLNQPLVLLLAFGEPRSLAVADIDGDGDTDLGFVYQNADSGIVNNDAGTQRTLLMQRNDGNWKFGTSFFPLSAGSSALSAQDLNSDGRPDLAVASSAKLSIFLNETRFPASRDCNSNATPDECDLASGILSDTVPPVLTCPDHVTVFCTDAAGARLNVRATAQDACRGEISVVRSPPLDFVFAPGTHTVTSTATDAAGNSSSCSFSVTVLCPRQLPGDCNQDAVLDLSDAVCVLGVLFTGNPPRFPCGDGLPGDPGNVALLDMQPDGAIDLSDGVSMLRFLFAGGPPHPLAVPGDELRGCVPVPGCPEGPLCP